MQNGQVQNLLCPKPFCFIFSSCEYYDSTSAELLCSTFVLSDCSGIFRYFMSEPQLPSGYQPITLSEFSCDYENKNLNKKF